SDRFYTSLAPHMDLTILWVFIAMLIAGGVMGFVKAKSKASLIASLAFAIPLILSATGILPPLVADICLVILLIFFGKKYATGKKFMPAGLMTILSILTLLLRLVF
ncbi:TMEM14 family protein, partial [bacterium]|nr:TMEM14 family protein [bacterium]